MKSVKEMNEYWDNLIKTQKVEVKYYLLGIFTGFILCLLVVR